MNTEELYNFLVLFLREAYSSVITITIDEFIDKFNKVDELVICKEKKENDDDFIFIIYPKEILKLKEIHKDFILSYMFYSISEDGHKFNIENGFTFYRRGTSILDFIFKPEEIFNNPDKNIFYVSFYENNDELEAIRDLSYSLKEIKETNCYNIFLDYKNYCFKRNNLKLRAMVNNIFWKVE